MAAKTFRLPGNMIVIDYDDAEDTTEHAARLADVGAGTDTDAIHDDVAGEISAVTEKATPVNADLVLIEDSADSNNKKRVQIGNLPFVADVAQAHIVDADGTLADITTKFNDLLSKLEALGLLNTS